MSSIINKVKDALHSDKSETSTTAHPTHSTTTHSTTHPTTTTHSTTSGIPEGTAGPHGSRVANAADPTVDSDLDRNHAARNHPTGTHNTTGSGLTGTHGTTGTHNTTGSGLTGTHGTHGTTGTTGTYGSSGVPEGAAGPHGSRVANAADPTVDSDLDRSHAARNHPTGTHNTTSTHGTTGTHNTTGSGLTGAGYGTDPSNVGNPKSTNAGPHGSNILNTLDPRVDSDLNGSKTIGGNKTYQGDNTTTGRDHTDASQVPPSVLAAHKGEPIVAHDHAGANHSGRHGSLSGQDNLSGI